MQRRVSLFALLILGGASIASLGVTECSEQIQSGVIDALGRHEDRLDALERCECEGVLAPVCGANGKTYVNRCEARCADVEVVAVGHCEQPECGGPHGIACGDGKFCETGPGCDAMAAGTCEDKPEVCTDQYDPVCGCDGKTYANDCERRAAGVPIDFHNACENAPHACDTNDECAGTEYCSRREGVCDAHPGVCTLRPEACTLDYVPVCGCDDHTYSNACAAAGAGVSVQYDGECHPGPVACQDNGECQANEFCKKHLGQCQAEGECAPRPDVCPLYVAPVCGCDAETYDNECAAAAAGVSLASQEACKPATVVICHIPPGNPKHQHTINVGESAVPAHLAHGDHLGPCTQ